MSNSRNTADAGSITHARSSAVQQRQRVEVSILADDPSPAQIQTPRLMLRPLAESDARAFAAVVDASRDHLDAFLPLGAVDQPSQEIFRRQLDLTLEGEATGRACRRIAVDRASDAIVGAFNLVVIRRGLEMEADVSCWLAAGRTGKGLAREGLAALLSYSFAELPEGLGLHRVDGFIAPGNQSSEHLAASLGFTKQPESTNHLAVGDRWQMHQRWSLSISAWLRDHA